ANTESNTGNNEASASTNVTVDDGLSIAKFGPATIAPNQAIAYQIVVSNTGPSAATNVIASDPLPASVENAIAASSRGACTVAAGVVTCNVGTLLPGEVVHVVINGYVASDASGDLSNTATAVSADDPTGVADTTATAVQAVADVALAMSSTPTAAAGTSAIVMATVANIGPSVADGAVLTITLPAGASYSSAELPEGWNVA